MLDWQFAVLEYDQCLIQFGHDARVERVEVDTAAERGFGSALMIVFLFLPWMVVCHYLALYRIIVMSPVMASQRNERMICTAESPLLTEIVHTPVNYSRTSLAHKSAHTLECSGVGLVSHGY